MFPDNPSSGTQHSIGDKTWSYRQEQNKWVAIPTNNYVPPDTGGGDTDPPPTTSVYTATLENNTTGFAGSINLLGPTYARAQSYNLHSGGTLSFTWTGNVEADAQEDQYRIRLSVSITGGSVLATTLKDLGAGGNTNFTLTGTDIPHNASGSTAITFSAEMITGDAGYLNGNTITLTEEWEE